MRPPVSSNRSACISAVMSPQRVLTNDLAGILFTSLPALTPEDDHFRPGTAGSNHRLDRINHGYCAHNCVPSVTTTSPIDCLKRITSRRHACQPGIAVRNVSAWLGRFPGILCQLTQFRRRSHGRNTAFRRHSSLLLWRVHVKVMSAGATRKTNSCEDK